MIDQGMGKQINELNLNYFLYCLKFFVKAIQDQSVATGIKDLKFLRIIVYILSWCQSLFTNRTLVGWIPLKKPT